MFFFLILIDFRLMFLYVFFYRSLFGRFVLFLYRLNGVLIIHVFVYYPLFLLKSRSITVNLTHNVRNFRTFHIRFPFIISSIFP